MALKAVAFDVGETIVDETRYWDDWADWFGIRTFELNALLGATIASREPHRTVFERARPGIDVDAEFAARRSSGRPDMFFESDLFADARPCLEALTARGLRTCVAGNQPPWMADEMRRWNLGVEFVTDTAELRAIKPDPLFFTHLVDRLGVDPREVAYVGDRADNDVVPARESGMLAVFLRRGPWGRIMAGWPEAGRAHVTVESLTELPEALRGL